MTQSNSISTWLGLSSSTGGGTLSGDGDTYKIEKSSTKFQLGKGVRDIRSTAITDDGMPTLLADGTYIDNDNDEFDYTQKLEVANMTLGLFDDNDYMANTPTIGFQIASNSNVLNYTFDFSKNPTWNDLASSNINFMGTDYYVLSVDQTVNTTLVLLDSSETTILSEGDTATVGGKVVSIEYVGNTPETKLKVGDEITTSLEEGQTYHLSSGEYLGIKDIMYNSKDTGISKVEFSIGNGRLTLEHGTDIQLNEDTIDGLSAEMGGHGTTTITSIKLVWAAADDLFVTPDSEITMPGFGSIKMSFTGMDYPSTETFVVENSGSTNIVLSDFPLKDTTEDITILEWDATNGWFDLVGKDTDEKLFSTNESNFTLTTKGNDKYEWAVLSWSDGSDAESYLIRATGFKTESDVNKTTIQYRNDGTWTDLKVDASPTNTFTIGNIEMTIGAIDRAKGTVRLETADTNVEFDVLYSKDGMKVYLPWFTNTTQALAATSALVNDSNACASLSSAGNRQIGSLITYNSTGTTRVTGRF
jgi:hypothetical protein